MPKLASGETVDANSTTERGTKTQKFMSKVIKVLESDFKDRENGFAQFEIEVNNTRYIAKAEMNYKWTSVHYSLIAEWQFVENVWDWEYEIKNPISKITIQEIIETEFTDLVSDFENELFEIEQPYFSRGLSPYEF